jgi:plasmid maintenance system antidote protein VapI
MTSEFDRYKGIHPGLILERELKKRKLSQRPFALSLPEHPQTFNAITKGKRDLNTALSLKIEKALNLEEGTLMILQIFYDIKKEKQKESQLIHPNFNILRKLLFWDTDIQKIDWEKHYKYVIQRVFERGNYDEQQELIRFYGEQKINGIINSMEQSGRRVTLMPHLNKR